MRRIQDTNSSKLLFDLTVQYGMTQEMLKVYREIKVLLLEKWF